MKTTNLPGFTAVASLYRTSERYCAVAAATDAMTAGASMPALQVGAEPDWVDCNEPFAYLCQECGGTGPGSIRCCRNDNCAVIDRWPTWGGFRFLAR